MGRWLFKGNQNEDPSGLILSGFRYFGNQPLRFKKKRCINSLHSNSISPPVISVLG